MKISETMLPEFDQEMANTRKVLERVPAAKFSWKPHPKSFEFGALAAHVANMADWAELTLNSDSFDYAPPGAPPYETPKFASTEDLVAAFDKSIAKARTALAGGRRQPDDGALEPDGGRKRRDDDAEGCSGPDIRDEPHYSSSRPVDSLPAAERYPGSRTLRAIGRRAIGEISCEVGPSVPGCRAQ